jgi:hypothetical protein
MLQVGCRCPKGESLEDQDDESNSMVRRNLDRRADICGSLYGDCRSCVACANQSTNERCASQWHACRINTTGSDCGDHIHSE